MPHAERVAQGVNGGTQQKKFMIIPGVGAPGRGPGLQLLRVAEPRDLTSAELVEVAQSQIGPENSLAS